ncbi:response regulator [Ornithinibacillus bavariensis]|uniref:Response regulator n=1 Tax=Ornithinibacillus bavariensis TaxID=545502 RepID=A0A920C7M8_9BACI|nr:response regulator [Ornithinibacillus bavariensis]GIO26832.1 response regulator [Ornithinibacillus bavariensis]
MKKKILIVDDEAGIRLLLEDLLESDRHEIFTAKSGKEALELLSIHTFDLLIIDYKLPITDGVEVIKQLEKEHKELSIIVMSGLVENIKDEVITLRNVKKVLSKPFNVLEVKEFVNQLLVQ